MGRRSRKRAVPCKDDVEEQICIFSEWNPADNIEKGLPEPINPLSAMDFESDATPATFSAASWSGWRESWKRLQMPPTSFQLMVWSLWTTQPVLQILAPTGTGKTLTYSLPLLQSKLSTSVVLVPTRELCRQVQQECKRMATQEHSILAWYGGMVDKQSQFATYRQTIESSPSACVLVATPGRMLDILESYPDAIKAETIVLDEADRLAMNQDLSGQVRGILEAMQPTKVIFCSATQSHSSRDIWKTWMETSFDKGQKLAVVQLKAPSRKGAKMEPLDDEQAGETISTKKNWSQIPQRVTQVVHVCAQHKKRRKLLQTLSKLDGPGLVFFAQIKTLKETSQMLKQSTKLNVMEYHSRLSQRERERKLQGIVLTTDLCARGIHWEEARWVVNYDFPGNLENYIHRCGRVGRTSYGTVYSFFTRNLKMLSRDLLDLLESSNQWIDPNLRDLAQSRRGKQKVDSNGEARSAKDEELFPDDDENAFAVLAGDRIVLKRASHVSDASSSSDSEGNGDN